MTYQHWFDQHASKHQKLVKKLLDNGFSKDWIIDYFEWENLVEAEPDFCPLFADKKRCHDMENLNCYLCACPNFRFNDNAPVLKSYCSIDSKDGAQMTFEGITHQDCSNCTVPHHRDYIEKKFDLDWKTIMKACQFYES